MLPILLVLVVAVLASTAWIIYKITHPATSPYLVTPEKFTQLSSRGVKATEESWSNRDGTRSRGWVLRGNEGSPAVVLLHRYGTDRSWLLNLGVKINEQTNFTIIWPDLRAHGQNPLIKTSTLGFKEGDDALAAIDYLKALKTPAGRPLVGEKIGMYGIELGAYAALRAAEQDPKITTLVLDSVPSGPDNVVNIAVKTQIGIDNRPVRAMAKLGMQAFLMGHYDERTSCQLASILTKRSVLLLASDASGSLQGSTADVAHCFPAESDKVEIQTSLPLSGFSLHPSTGQQEEQYDRRAIDFFDQELR